MTYLANLPEITRPEYPLDQTQWREGARRVRSNVVVRSFLLPSLLLRMPVSGSSIALPVFPEETKIWQETGGSTVRSFELQVWWVEQLYTFRRPEEVSWFLQAHPFLIPLLFEAYAQIANHFGSYPLVFLEVITDPEAIDDRQLAAFIRTDLDPTEALASLDRFDRSWWLEASHRSRGKLCIHLE